MIAHSFDEAFSLVRDLAHDFRQNEAHFLSTQYSEPRVREDFINKFWMALGWDVTHREQKNPYEQEVTVEKNVNIEGRGKRADYAFTVAPNFRDVRFFVEAKKPSRNIDNADDYFQTVRYGWNARTSVAVLTDFEQFRVLDCRYEPDIGSVLSYGALEKFHYTDYTDAEKFRRIYHLFSRADVAGGSLERYVESLPKPGARGQRALFVTGRFKSVDESFLQKLDEYRERLAQTFKRNNPRLESMELTEVTQRTLDRLVFMRFLEDKTIETSEMVQKIVDSARPWREFVATSRKLNATYNGIIFKEHELLDDADFEVDESAFVDICASLSYARSPYNFNYIPVHILGSIYERFLGKTIVVEGAEARVEDKPEVRKAGGVYYTPEYIVRYIVENTVGQLIDGKTPGEINVMRFADISCGSGSFLIGVYDLLLRYHRTYYNANKKRRAEGRRAGCVELPDGTLQLSLKQKRAILTNNIYGVDIDAQAVEVAQLSLYLKLLEDETTASARLYQIELGDKLLPSLGRNIVSGNSLIGWDILSGKLFDKHEERKLNPMSFEQEFPQIMRDGGFDAIVGNPPYALIGSDRPAEQEYYRANFSLTAYKTNTYVLFLEKGLQLLRPEGGALGFIIPKSLAFNTYFSSARKQLISTHAISGIVEIRDKVFANAEVGDSILFFARTDSHPGENNLIYYKVKNVFPTFDILEKHQSTQRELLAHPDSLFYSRQLALRAETKPLSEIAAISNGLNPGNVRHLLLSESPQTSKHRKMVLGRDIQTYLINWSGTWVNYDPKLKDRIKVSDIKSKKGMTAQTKVDFALRSPEIYAANKIIVRKTADHLIATYDSYGYHFDSLAYGIQTKPNTPETPLYLLGLLNSRLLNFIHGTYSLNKEKVFAKVLSVNLSKLPIRIINFSNPTDKARHDKVVHLVEQMLDAKRQLAEAVMDRDKNLYERKCANLGRQIDELVYELYGLTKEEIALVEAG